MSIKEDLLEQLDDLSVDELWNLQELVTQKLRRKTTFNGNSSPELKNANSIEAIILPKPTQEEIEAGLREFLGDDYEAAMAVDLSKLPSGEKTLAQIVSEEREDRV